MLAMVHRIRARMAAIRLARRLPLTCSHCDALVNPRSARNTWLSVWRYSCRCGWWSHFEFGAGVVARVRSKDGRER